MNDFDYILELFEKKDLSALEKQKLSKLLESSKEARDFFNYYEKLKLLFEKQGHIPTEVLGEYVMLKNGNGNTNGYLLPKTPWIEKHLRECSKCNYEFLEFNEEYNSVDSFLEENLPHNNENRQKNHFPDIKQPVRSFFNWKTGYLRIAFSIVALIAVLYSGLYVASSYVVPVPLKYASLDAKTDFYITRGRVSPEFQQSVLAIQNGDYESAIKYLNNDIHLNNSDETIFYTYYILGLTYLESAQSNLLGLFPSYNKNRVLLGIGNLKESIKRNNSGKYPNINYDSYYFIGKANLMINNITEARKYLQMVVDDKGSKLEESKEILQKLNHN